MEDAETPDTVEGSQPDPEDAYRVQLIRDSALRQAILLEHDLPTPLPPGRGFPGYDPETATEEDVTAARAYRRDVEYAVMERIMCNAERFAFWVRTGVTPARLRSANLAAEMTRMELAMHFESEPDSPLRDLFCGDREAGPPDDGWVQDALEGEPEIAAAMGRLIDAIQGLDEAGRDAHLAGAEQEERYEAAESALQAATRGLHAAEVAVARRLGGDGNGVIMDS